MEQASATAPAAVRAKGTIFEPVFRRLNAWMRYQQAICAVGHRFYRLIWKFCVKAQRYEEREPTVDPQSKRYNVCVGTANPA